jgi:hypothetical protein
MTTEAKGKKQGACENVIPVNLHLKKFKRSKILRKLK